MDMKKLDGFTREQLDYWIKGKMHTDGRPRWCVIKDVLGW